MQSRIRSSIALAAVIAVAMLAVVNVAPTNTAEAGVTGGLHTTDVNCAGVDLNSYGNKLDVYLEGGPSKVGASALTPGDYGVQVTSPNGTLLGASDGTSVTVLSNGVLPCTQLWLLVEKDSDGTQGYDDTTNNGGVYKVQICLDNDFDSADCKSDNFKVANEAPPFDACTPAPNRIIVTWPGTALGNPITHPGSLVQESAPTVVDVSAGTYVVTLQSYDDHTGHGGQGQLNEQWFAIFLDGGTPIVSSATISDLPGDQDVLNEIVGEVTLASDADSVVARHELYNNWAGIPESVVPTCMALDPVR